MSYAWTPLEGAALRQLYIAHGDDWRLHIGSEPRLFRRSISDCIGRLKAKKFYQIPRVPQIVADPAPRRGDWPAPGVILFDDDPRATRDHGSPERLSRPEVMRSLFGCALNGLRGSGL